MLKLVIVSDGLNPHFPMMSNTTLAKTKTPLGVALHKFSFPGGCLKEDALQLAFSPWLSTPFIDASMLFSEQLC